MSKVSTIYEVSGLYCFRKLGSDVNLSDVIRTFNATDFTCITRCLNCQVPTFCVMYRRPEKYGRLVAYLCEKCAKRYVFDSSEIHLMCMYNALFNLSEQK